MKAAIVDPYLDTLGGGERYMMTVASVLRKNGWEVEIEWDTQDILQALGSRLNIDLSGVRVVDSVKAGSGYDLIFWLSDGSIPTLYAKRNILHFQTPFHNIEKNWILDKLKITRISKIVCNSNFTKGIIDKEYGAQSIVVYPPVAVDKFQPLAKENLILFVGRFSQLQQAKRQDVLIEVFKKMCKSGLEGWKLILVGGNDVGNGDYVNNLRELAQGYPVKVLENASFDKIVELYGKAKIFWSASGYDIDEEKNPEKVEHFGITVVEAMAAGCVPVVTAKGGHFEIVTNGMDGFLWTLTEELEELTFDLIKDERRRKEIAAKARSKSSKFSEESFEGDILQIIK